MSFLQLQIVTEKLSPIHKFMQSNIQYAEIIFYKGKLSYWILQNYDDPQAVLEFPSKLKIRQICTSKRKKPEEKKWEVIQNYSLKKM